MDELESLRGDTVSETIENVVHHYWGDSADVPNDVISAILVLAANIGSGSGGELEPGSVTAELISDGAVTSDKIYDAAVTTAKLLDGSVTAQKLADNSVTADKLSRTGFLDNAILGVADGDVLAIEDSVGSPVTGFTAYGETHVREYSPTDMELYSVTGATITVAGRNLANVRSDYRDGKNSLSINANPDGSIHVQGRPTKNTSFLFSERFYMERGVTYSLSGCPAGGGYNKYRLYVDTTELNSAHKDDGDGVTFVAGDWEDYGSCVGITVYKNASVNFDFYPMLCVGDTPLPYEPYAGESVPIDLQGNELRSLPDGTRDELRVDSSGSVTLIRRTEKTEQASTDGVTGTVGVDVISTTGAIEDGATVIYKLANPVSVSLGTIDMPTIPASFATVWSENKTIVDDYGYIYNDYGQYARSQITLTYERNAGKAYSALCDQVAPSEDTTAAASHAVGDLFMLHGTLCKATSAISVGDTVAVGTNCATTTIAEQLALKADA